MTARTVPHRAPSLASQRVAPRLRLTAEPPYVRVEVPWWVSVLRWLGVGVDETQRGAR